MWEDNGDISTRRSFLEMLYVYHPNHWPFILRTIVVPLQCQYAVLPFAGATRLYLIQQCFGKDIVVV